MTLNIYADKLITKFTYKHKKIGEEKMNEAYVGQIGESLIEISRMTNPSVKQHDVKNMIDEVIKSLPGDNVLFASTPPDNMDQGTYLVILDLGIGKKFIVCEFDLWIDRLSKYTEAYIYKRILSGLETKEREIENSFNRARSNGA